jgi:glycosyltransferase involved in cell wall biosynthesis
VSGHTGGSSDGGTFGQKVGMGQVRIGIDYTAAVRQRAGIGRYTRNLVRALAALDSHNSYVLFTAGGRVQSNDSEPWPANFRLRQVPVSDRWLHILWQRLRLPVRIQLVTGKLDLFHSPDFVLPPVGRTPALVTVHDLSFLRLPECFVPGFAEYLRSAVSRAVRRANCIVADSESTRTDLIDLMAVDDSRVAVLYPGVEARFQPVVDKTSLDRVRHNYGLPSSFVLGLGTLQPRKNFVALIDAFQRLLHAEAASTQPQDLQLVLAGEKGWMYDEIPLAARKAGIEDRVQFVGFVADSDLPALYSLASVFAFPSLYEGFGLPVLEAMACGVPVVAADNSSLPEVVGEAGLLVNARDADGLARALSRLLRDRSLRDRLVAAGHKQAQRFAWGRAAEQLLALYGQI